MLYHASLRLGPKTRPIQSGSTANTTHETEAGTSQGNGDNSSDENVPLVKRVKTVVSDQED